MCHPSPSTLIPEGCTILLPPAAGAQQAGKEPSLGGTGVGCTPESRVTVTHLLESLIKGWGCLTSCLPQAPVLLQHKSLEMRAVPSAQASLGYWDPVHYPC